MQVASPDVEPTAAPVEDEPAVAEPASSTAIATAPTTTTIAWVSRRSTIIRAPTVSTPGESRSCGSVSHDGNIATLSPIIALSSAVRSSASRLVAVTASTGAWWARVPRAQGRA